ncbi:MAG: tetratricopeptide repeat protein, partial [Myxococcales bacterium]
PELVPLKAGETAAPVPAVAVAPAEPAKPAVAIIDEPAKPALAAEPAPVKEEPRAEEPKSAPPDTEALYARLVADGNRKLASNKLRGAVTDFKQALKYNPDGAEALIGAGLALVDSAPKQAIPFLVRGIAADPKNARAHVALGTAYQMEGKPRDAAKAYEGYLALAPDGEFAAEVRMILKDLKR